jgi:hypothetical protein
MDKKNYRLTNQQILHKFVKLTAMGWACGTYGGEERYIQTCSGETRKTDHREDLDVDIKMDRVEKQGGRA